MRNWDRKTRLLVMVLVVPPLIVLVAILGGTIVRLLWNWLLPPLFGLPPITLWQALGLLVLSRILFGGLGMHGDSGRRYRRRWEAMTPEEREQVRERLRARMRERWGSPPPSSEGTGR